MKKFIATNLSLMEFALRLYVAYYLWSYGSSKLDGTMFNNTTPAMLKTPLQNVDMFHLTWYYYSQSKVLATATGILQILAAGLLVVNRTVLAGCLIAFPIFLSILFVDIDSTTHFFRLALPARVTFYLFCLTLFCIYRKETVKPIIVALFPAQYKLQLPNKWNLLLIPVFLIACLAVELGIALLVHLLTRLVDNG